MTSYEMTAGHEKKIILLFRIYANVEENMHVGAEAWMANCVVCTDGVSLSTLFIYKQMKME